MKYLLFIFLLISCNAFETLLDAETKIDEGFGEGVKNEDILNIESLENQLIGFWRFDESAGADRSSNNGSITFTDNVDVGVSPGVRGNSLDCSSHIASGVNFLDTGTLNNAFTVPNSATGTNISFWLKVGTLPAGGAATYQVILSYGGAEIGFGEPTVANTYGIIVSSGGLSVVLDNLNTSNINFNEWNHFSINLFSSNFSQNRIFVNGRSQAVSTATSTAQSVSSMALCSGSGGSSILTSSIDSLGIWDRALTFQEIDALASGRTQLD